MSNRYRRMAATLFSKKTMSLTFAQAKALTGWPSLLRKFGINHEVYFIDLQKVNEGGPGLPDQYRVYVYLFKEVEDNARGW